MKKLNNKIAYFTALSNCQNGNCEEILLQLHGCILFYPVFQQDFSPALYKRDQPF